MSPQFPTIVLRAQSDERLAHLAACGNERAFEAIVDRYRQPLLRYATRMIGDSRADDVVQAAFVSAWSKLAQGEEVRELKAWLYRIVHNGSLNAMKRASSKDLPLLSDNPMSSGDDSHAEVERREEVRQALGEIAALPEQQRHAFLAVAVEGRRHREVGEELGVSEGAVRMLIHRARSSVRAAAAALSPWPFISWLKGSAGAGAATTAASTGGAAAGSSAGAGLLAGGVLKAGALIAATGIVATAGPQAVRAIHESSPQQAAVTASAPAARATHATWSGVAAAPGAALSAPKIATATSAAPAAVSPPRSAPESTTPADAVPAPADTTVPASAPPAGVIETSTTVIVPPHLGHREFIAPAAYDDDLVEVDEEAPDYADGERDIPAGGVDDQTAASVGLSDDPPAEALQAPTSSARPSSRRRPRDARHAGTPVSEPDESEGDNAGSANAPLPVTP